MNNEESTHEQVKSMASLFNLNPEMAEVHQQFLEVTRRIERIEQRLPSSWIPQYRVRDDKEYKPLGKVLDQIFEELDNLYDQIDNATKGPQVDYQKELDKLDNAN